MPACNPVPPIRKPGARPVPTGPIRADECYSLEQFLARVGWKRAAFTQARREGLKAGVSGGRVYILGAWFIEHLAGKVKTAKPTTAEG